MENIGKVWFEEKRNEGREGEEDYFSRCEDGNVQTFAERETKVMDWDKRDEEIKKWNIETEHVDNLIFVRLNRDFNNILNVEEKWWDFSREGSRID